MSMYCAYLLGGRQRLPRVHRKTTRHDGRGRWQAGTRRSELPLYLEQDMSNDNIVVAFQPAVDNYGSRSLTAADVRAQVPSDERPQ